MFSKRLSVVNLRILSMISIIIGFVVLNAFLRDIAGLKERV